MGNVVNLPISIVDESAMTALFSLIEETCNDLDGGKITAFEARDMLADAVIVYIDLNNEKFMEFTMNLIDNLEMSEQKEKTTSE